MMITLEQQAEAYAESRLPVLSGDEWNEIYTAFLAGAEGKQELYEALKELSRVVELEEENYDYKATIREWQNAATNARAVLAKYEQEKKQ